MGTATGWYAPTAGMGTTTGWYAPTAGMGATARRNAPTAGMDTASTKEPIIVVKTIAGDAANNPFNWPWWPRLLAIW
jgi:hypothetical protein